MVDHSIPLVTVWYKNQNINQVLIDDGSGVNIAMVALCKKLGWNQIEPVQLFVRMAHQSRVHPVGLVRNISITLQGTTFKMTFVVLELPESSLDYNLLFGRPWLWQAKVVQDWSAQELSFKDNHRKYVVTLDAMQPCELHARPYVVEPVHMLDGLSDDEEEAFLQSNKDLSSLGTVDLQSVVDNWSPTVCTVVPMTRDAEADEDITMDEATAQQLLYPADDLVKP
ncbi:hypothetical protein KP509_15G027800 [Ceratopteris richardii]|uniref:Uncharacterized protein n=1 Tax=Ceratopteris richardii TaxID=49495 RepID=A0A8T2T5P2_CERRI|nr:hypothetical protein KP509_15G027800 [Ceratopteris richardii]